MKHIKDIYPLVNEVRQRIIEKMRAENISVVKFCPADEDEYLETHKGEDRVEDYYDYRNVHCPCVIWFDKYGSGEDLFVMSVSLTDGEHPYFVLHCDSEYSNRDLNDDEVAWLTMLNVYESLESELGLEDEPRRATIELPYNVGDTVKWKCDDDGKVRSTKITQIDIQVPETGYPVFHYWSRIKIKGSMRNALFYRRNIIKK